MTWIKICGTTNSHDAAVAVDAGADALGFIFAPSRRRSTPETARQIIAAIPGRIEKIGVFVNEAPEHIARVVSDIGLTAIQLHGDEDAAYVQRLRARLEGDGIKNLLITRAIAVRTGFERLLDGVIEQRVIDRVLLDSPPQTAAVPRGGSGRTFDWELAAEALISLPARIRVVVGGGLTSDNVGHAITKLRPWGVDVVSGVEREPGRKDPQKVKAFVAAVRAASERS